MSENALQKIEPMPSSPSVEGMITLAIEKGASVDTLERLMAIRREVRAEQAKEAYDRALASFQAECPTIRKTAKVMNKDGRSVRYQYAPLDAIISQVKEILQRHGFSYTVNAQAMPGNVKATCKLTHAYGHSETSEFEVPIDKDAYMNPAQQVASALTFAKRYAFCNAAGIMTGDADDDSQASFNEKANKTPGASNVPRRTSAPTTQSTAKPPAPAQATEEQRLRWIAELKRRGVYAQGYCQDKGWLLPASGPEGDMEPGEPIELLDLRHVPVMTSQAKAILAELDALLPDSFTLLPAEAPSAVESKGKPAPKTEPEHHKAPWYNFPMPWGKNSGKILGKLPKNYLFGLWANWQPETEYKGKPKSNQDIASDRLFREMLDAAGVFYEFRDEKAQEPEENPIDNDEPPF